ncbi:MAG: RNA polymerase sigma factor [Paludibacter sp.]
MANDRDIWSRFKAGDNESLTLMYSENFKKLYLFGIRITSNQTIVEDSIQDLFTDLVRNRKKLGDTNNIHFYLLKSFKRKLVRQLQKENRYNLKNKNEEIVFDITYSVEHFTILNENADLKLQSLQIAKNKLKPRQKEAIYLRFTEELEYNEIAEIMEMSIESCRNLIFRAIKSLRDSLKADTSILLFLLQKLA